MLSEGIAFYLFLLLLHAYTSLTASL